MDLPAAFPPYLTEQQCIVMATAHYKAHPLLVQAVRMTENGKVGQVIVNKNGSSDLGPMGINTVNLPELSKLGITKDMLVQDGCLNIFIGTYYLQKAILKAPDIWTGVGNYRSKTPSYNLEYQRRVWSNLQKLQSQQRGAQ
jgi:hypothetical protein